jgi:hypothetical protein
MPTDCELERLFQEVLRQRATEGEYRMQGKDSTSVIVKGGYFLANDAAGSPARILFHGVETRAAMRLDNKL